MMGQQVRSPVQLEVTQLLLFKGDRDAGVIDGIGIVDQSGIDFAAGDELQGRPDIDSAHDLVLHLLEDAGFA